MKRLIWLMLFAFGSLLVRVPAVEPLFQAEQCACGTECVGQCGMPDCALPAAATTPQLAGDRAVTLVRPAAKRHLVLGERSVDRYLAVPLASIRSLPAPSVADRTASAAGVPLFREHCSLLI